MRLSHRRRPGPVARGERGETLIELMATVVLMGVSIVALIGSLLGAMTTSNTHRRATRAGNEAVNVVEDLRGQTYVPCATTTTYTLPTPPPTYTYTIESVRRLQNANANPAVWVSNAGCTPTNDQGAQIIKIRVRSAGTPAVSRSLSLVKRKV